MAEDTKKIESITLLKSSPNNIDFKNQKIKDYEDHTLFDFVISQSFLTLFLDLQEVREFISYLYKNKSELSIEELINNPDIIIREFKQK